MFAQISLVFCFVKLDGLSLDPFCRRLVFRPVKLLAGATLPPRQLNSRSAG